MGRQPGGKASRAHQLVLAAKREAALLENGDAGLGGIGFDDSEPPLAPPARKKARPEPNEPTRKSRRIDPPHAPPPRGPPAEKPKQRPAAELSPDSLKKRREDQNRWRKDSYQRKKQKKLAEVAAEVAAEAPYARSKTGKECVATKGATASRKSRAGAKLERTLHSFGSDKQAAQVVKDVLDKRKPGVAAELEGYHPSEEVETALFQQQQRKNMISRARETAKPQGRAADDQRSAVESNVVFGAASPAKAGQKVPSGRAQARSVGLPTSTASRMLKAAKAKRAKLTAREERISWSQVEARRGHSKITTEVRAKLHEWVLNHPRVVQSPIANDTLFVLNEETGKKERVGKLLLEISVRELHNNLIALPVDAGGPGGGLAEARDDAGKIIISDTALRYLLPPQLKAMTERHKLMCGCETCLVPDTLQRSLNAFRARLKRELTAKAKAMPSAGGRAAKQRKEAALHAANNYQPTLNLSPPSPWHLKPGLALGEIQCEPCEGGHGFPHWSCVLRCCESCPEYPVPEQERGTDDDAPKIRFHVYKTVTECTEHGIITPGAKLCAQCTARLPPLAATAKPGKVRSRKHLTELCTPIGIFHRDYYLPALDKLAYHRPHCRILGKEHSGKARLAAYKTKPSIRTRRDYAERLAAAFTLEAQHEHFGNGRSLSMEGSSVETFCEAAVDAWKNGVWQMNEAELKMVFHSHFSDDSRQDAATTHAHMHTLFSELRGIGELCAGLTVWDDTDGCAKQYRCGTAFFLLSVLAGEFGIAIDRAIGAPGHGKDVVDALNATDKVYLRKMMCMIGTPEANDSEARMRAHSMLGDEKMSLAEESARLCRLPERAHGVKSEGGKRTKREAAAKMQQRFYHVQDPAKVKYKNVNMTAVGFDEGDHNGMLAHYNVRVSKQLGVGKAAVRRIPCACSACLAQLNLPWQPGVAAELQPMFASSTSCIFWPIFMRAAGEPGLNDWRIVKLEPKKSSDPEEAEEARAEVLAGMTELMAETIQIGAYGAIATTDEDADGYYIVRWTTEPYTIQEAVAPEKYGWAIRAGELVCEAEYFNKVAGAKHWYTPTQGEERKVVVRVQQVVAADLEMSCISQETKLPSNLSKKAKAEAARLGAVYLDPEEHERVLDESCRRTAVEHDEIIDDDSSDDEETAEESEEEGDGEGDGEE